MTDSFITYWNPEERRMGLGRARARAKVTLQPRERGGSS